MTTSLWRYLQSAEHHSKKLVFPYIDECGKVTVAKYKLVGTIAGNVFDNFVWRLDGRSVRYMQRVKIIENTKSVHLMDDTRKR